MNPKLYGNIQGLSSKKLTELERLYRRRIPRENITTSEFNRAICAFSKELNREIGALVNRDGTIEYIIVGWAKELELPDQLKLRRNPTKFSGLRLIHTHLNKESLDERDLTYLCLFRLDLVLAVLVDGQGYPSKNYLAHLKPYNEQKSPFEIYPPIFPGKLDLNFEELICALEEEFARQRPKKSFPEQEGVILVKVVLSREAKSKERKWEIEQEILELKELARSAGVSVLDSVVQYREHYDNRYLIGTGKLRELSIKAMQLGAQTLIFDSALTPAQLRAIEDEVGLKVIDRTQLIMDIFAQRAHTREGKIQVELAQYRYLLTRLVGKGAQMSRLLGGIGTRGPGETKLEVDRRRIKERIHHLEKEIEQIRRARAQRRTLRERRNVPVVSIVGYTNTGKSTLLNALTESNVNIQDKYFATLDPSTRRIRFPRERELIITDTVGFIRDLPRELFSAFQATLEELNDADLLIHLADASSPELERQIDSVNKILSQLNLEDVPTILVLNKIDLLSLAERKRLAREYNSAIQISALDRSTFLPLLLRIELELFNSSAKEDEWLSLGYSGSL